MKGDQTRYPLSYEEYLVCLETLNNLVHVIPLTREYQTIESGSSATSELQLPEYMTSRISVTLLFSYVVCSKSFYQSSVSCAAHYRKSVVRSCQSDAAATEAITNMFTGLPRLARTII